MVLPLHRYSGGAPNRRRPSRFASSSFGSAIPIRHASFAPSVAACCQPRARGHWSRGAPLPPLRLNGWRRLRFPGSLVALPPSPCSPTPVGSRRPHQYWTTRCGLLDVQSHRLLRELISGLYHTARAFAVYASQWRSPPDHARLATGPLVRLWPHGTFTRWAAMQSFRITLTYPSPLPELRLAQ